MQIQLPEETHWTNVEQCQEQDFPPNISGEAYLQLLKYLSGQVNTMEQRQLERQTQRQTQGQRQRQKAENGGPGGLEVGAGGAAGRRQRAAVGLPHVED